MKAKIRLALLFVCGIAAPFIISKAIWGSGGNVESEFLNHGGVHIRRLSQPFTWNNGEEIENEQDSINETRQTNNNETKTCRNSVQGRNLIADDRGYVCNRFNLKGNGCCKTDSSWSKKYHCDGCQMASGCCEVFEHCVSCCMDPKHRTDLMSVLKEANLQSDILLLSASDHFELCLAKCRTNSRSVQHENLYINPKQKFCFMKSPPSPTTTAQPIEANERKGGDP